MIACSTAPLSAIIESYHSDTAHNYYLVSCIQLYLAGAMKCIAKGNCHEKSSQSSDARTWAYMFRSSTLYHWAMQEPPFQVVSLYYNRNNTDQRDK